MLLEYRRYLLGIRNNFIRSGVDIPSNDVQSYEDIFYLCEKLSDLLWFFSILCIGGSESRLRGFMFPLNAYYMSEARDRYFEDYLLYKSDYMKISVKGLNLFSKKDIIQETKQKVEDDVEKKNLLTGYECAGITVEDEDGFLIYTTDGNIPNVDEEDEVFKEDETPNKKPFEKIKVSNSLSNKGYEIADIPVEDDDGFLVYTTNGIIPEEDEDRSYENNYEDADESPIRSNKTEKSNFKGYEVAYIAVEDDDGFLVYTTDGVIPEENEEDDLGDDYSEEMGEGKEDEEEWKGDIDEGYFEEGKEDEYSNSYGGYTHEEDEEEEDARSSESNYSDFGSIDGISGTNKGIVKVDKDFEDRTMETLDKMAMGIISGGSILKSKLSSKLKN